jgi:L-threonylcarbamoyladenylate synthase
LQTLAVRIPAHAGAQAFLKEVDLPIVAPSANLSKHVSPTSAMHVFEDFEGKIPLILDGGDSVGGIESTVCDVTGDVPVVLRPGLITREQIAAVVGACDEYAPDFTKKEKVKSPGVLYKHYSPRCETVLYTPMNIEGAKAYCQAALAQGKRVAVLCEDGQKDGFDGVVVLNLGETETQMANRLYNLLREAEKVCDLLIAIEPTKQDGVMVGVLNRLRKACVSVDIQH